LLVDLTSCLLRFTAKCRRVKKLCKLQFGAWHK
jgi:hypothetical protein